MANQKNGWEDPADAVTPADPAWLKVARLELGIHELPGTDNEPRIQMYRSYRSGSAASKIADEVPWCADFVNWALSRVNVQGTGKANARSFLEWGQELARPRPGAITVFSRPPDPAHGHVSFYVGERGDSIAVLGGNQHNRVCIAEYPRERLLSYRWPIGIP